MNRISELTYDELENRIQIRELDNYLEHYGIPRRSGRYPWGSGKNPFQRKKQGNDASENTKNSDSKESSSSSSSSVSSGKKPIFRSDDESDRHLMSRRKNPNVQSLNYEYDEGLNDLFIEIQEKSGDGYSGEGVSSGFKKNRKELESALSEWYSSESAKQKRSEIDKLSKLCWTYMAGFFLERCEANGVKSFKDFKKKQRSVDLVGAYREDPLYKELNEKLRQAQHEYEKERRQIKDSYDDELFGIVLTDLGYRDTKKGRKFLKDMDVVFYD